MRRCVLWLTLEAVTAAAPADGVPVTLLREAGPTSWVMLGGEEFPNGGSAQAALATGRTQPGHHHEEDRDALESRVSALERGLASIK